MKPIITLLTDFGTEDYFVGAMKGVILSINPQAQIVDITHDVPPQDIYAAAFNLLCCYQSFPVGTIHVAVVDPGVGSARRGMLVQTGEHVFVGPDNGLFSWIWEQEQTLRAYSLTHERFFRLPVSNTFHGRDIFAPVAAHVSTGVALEEFGEPIDDPVALESVLPKQVGPGVVEGAIIHIDRFGNCITNLTLLHHQGTDEASLRVNGVEVRSWRRFFAEQGLEEPFCILGSAGFWEIAVRNGSAARTLRVHRGHEVILKT